MTGKERILTALAGGKADITPVGIDYLSLYLAERVERAYVEAYMPRLRRMGRLRIEPTEDVELRAQAILSAYDCFQEQGDWFIAFPGPSRETLSRRELVLEGDKVFEVDLATGRRRQMLQSGEESKTQEMQDLFEHQRRRYADRQHLDAILQDHKQRARDSRGDFSLVKLLADRMGAERFIYSGAGAPFWSLYGVLGFEGMMTALYDAPDAVFYMMDFLLDFVVENAQAFKEAGGHGLRIEECLASADIISAKIYERFALPYEEKLFSQLRRMGLKTILYFCGDVMPRLSSLRQLPIDALMVEESKKDFIIDIGAVRAAVGPALCLCGNVDAYGIVQMASEAELQAEVERQTRVAGAKGAFIAGVGSPLPLDLPPRRADLFVRFARQSGV